MKVEKAETQPSYILQYLNERALRAFQRRQLLQNESKKIIETARLLVAERSKNKKYDRQSLLFLDRRYSLIMAIREENKPPKSPLERLKKEVFLEKLNNPTPPNNHIK